MANIGTMLKAEIARLSRKEARKEVEATKRASAQHRRHIASLNRQVKRLEQELARLSKRTGSPAPAPRAEQENGGTKLRFVAKGFKSHRAKLGLSAADYARLLGVTAQSVYNWERNVAVPRREQLARIAALRGIGKREAQARLEALGE